MDLETEQPLYSPWPGRRIRIAALLLTLAAVLAVGMIASFQRDAEARQEQIAEHYAYCHLTIMASDLHVVLHVNRCDR